MITRKILRVLAACVVSLVVMDCAWAERAQPNIVFILVDDMGWMDVGGYGSDLYETPNIDRLAR